MDNKSSKSHASQQILRSWWLVTNASALLSRVVPLVAKRNLDRASKFRENKVESSESAGPRWWYPECFPPCFPQDHCSKTKLTVALRSSHLQWMEEGDHGWRQWQGGGMVGQDITLLQEKKGQRQSVKVLADPLHCSWLQLLGTLAANR